MLGLLLPFRFRKRPCRPAPGRQSRLQVEQLEDRFCPAAPTLSALTATQIGSSLVVTGQVSDESPATVRVDLGSAVTASVTPKCNGYFSYIQDNFSGGSTVTIQAFDNE